MLTFSQFLIELPHSFVSCYKDWGIIHPKSGRILSGLKDNKVRYHGELKDRVFRKIGKCKDKEIFNSPEYAFVDYGHGNGHLLIRGVTNDNKHAVLKAFDYLPHHQSGEVFVNSVKGPIFKMRNHLLTTNFDKRENE